MVDVGPLHHAVVVNLDLQVEHLGGEKEIVLARGGLGVLPDELELQLAGQRLQAFAHTGHRLDTDGGLEGVETGPGRQRGALYWKSREDGKT